MARMLSCEARLLPINIPSSEASCEVILHVKALVPVRVQRLPNDRGSTSLLSSYRSDGEWIWES